MAIPFVHVQAQGLVPGARPRRRRGGARAGAGLRRLLPRELHVHDERTPHVRRGGAAGAGLRGAARRWLPPSRGGAGGSGRGRARALRAPARPQLRRGVHVRRAGRGPPPPGSPRSGDHCTAVAVVAGGRHVVGHNMDWYVDRRRQQRPLRPHGAGRDARHGPGRRAVPAHARHEQPRRRQREQLRALQRQPHRRPQRVRAPGDAGGADAGGGARPRSAGRPRPRHQPVPRRHRRPAVGPRDVGHRARAHGPHGRRVHGARQPLRLAGHAALRGVRASTESPVRLADRRAAAAGRGRRGGRPGGARRPASCARTSRRSDQCICGHPELGRGAGATRA